MEWLPEGVKIVKIWLFLSTESTNVTGAYTDRQRPRNDIHLTCIALCGKNCYIMSKQGNYHCSKNCSISTSYSTLIAVAIC